VKCKTYWALLSSVLCILYTAVALQPVLAGDKPPKENNDEILWGYSNVNVFLDRLQVDWYSKSHTGGIDDHPVA